jgi:alkylation response protein AidB-like acyl-CoA dehydrogenase
MEIYPWLCQVSLPLLTAKIIVEHGSEEQKARYLPEFVNGSIFNVGLGN